MDVSELVFGQTRASEHARGLLRARRDWRLWRRYAEALRGAGDARGEWLELVVGPASAIPDAVAARARAAELGRYIPARWRALFEPA